MKPITSFAALCALAAVASASTTKPVGYETISIDPGFNFVSIRLHEAAVASGDLETVNSTSVVDADVDLGALMDGSTFILEIEDGSGRIQEVTASDGGTGLATADTSGITAPVNYTLRPASTFASVFGADNSAGLAAGTFGPTGADQIWLWNGSGWDQYYYDNFAPPSYAAGGWVAVATSTAIDPAAFDLVYADGFVVQSASGNDLVVTGTVKTGSTELNLASGFNFVGSVAPAGATLSTAFGASNTAGLAAGTFGPTGADQVWLWNGSGWDQYYYDNFAPPSYAAGGWVDVSTSLAVDPATINLASGYAIVSGGGNVNQDVPDSYDGL